MKWKKLGKIFNPTEYFISENDAGFAQSPQTLVFDSFVRIFNDQPTSIFPENV